MSKVKKKIRVSDPVYHADPETYQQVQAWCQDHGLRVKFWVDEVLRKALDLKPEPVVKIKKIEIRVPRFTALSKNLKPAAVQGKIESTPTGQNDPWSQRPFWETEKIVDK